MSGGWLGLVANPYPLSSTGGRTPIQQDFLSFLYLCLGENSSHPLGVGDHRATPYPMTPQTTKEVDR